MSKRKHQQQSRRAVRKVLNASDDHAATVKRGWSRDLHVSTVNDPDTPLNPFVMPVVYDYGD